MCGIADLSKFVNGKDVKCSSSYIQISDLIGVLVFAVE
jgi:hypothetical protein